MFIFLIIEFIIEEHLTRNESAKITVIDQNSVLFVIHRHIILQVRSAILTIVLVGTTISIARLIARVTLLRIVFLPIWFIRRPSRYPHDTIDIDIVA